MLIDAQQLQTLPLLLITINLLCFHIEKSHALDLQIFHLYLQSRSQYVSHSNDNLILKLRLNIALHVLLLSFENHIFRIKRLKVLGLMDCLIISENKIVFDLLD